MRALIGQVRHMVGGEQYSLSRLGSKGRLPARACLQTALLRTSRGDYGQQCSDSAHCGRGKKVELHVTAGGGGDLLGGGGFLGGGGGRRTGTARVWEDKAGRAGRAFRDGWRGESHARGCPPFVDVECSVCAMHSRVGGVCGCRWGA